MTEEAAKKIGKAIFGSACVLAGAYLVSRGMEEPGSVLIVLGIIFS